MQGARADHIVAETELPAWRWCDAHGLDAMNDMSGLAKLRYDF